MKAFSLKSKARQRDQRAYKAKAVINTQNVAWTRAEHSSTRFQPPIKSLGWGKGIFLLNIGKEHLLGKAKILKSWFIIKVIYLFR